MHSILPASACASHLSLWMVSGWGANLNVINIHATVQHLRGGGEEDIVNFHGDVIKGRNLLGTADHFA